MICLAMKMLADLGRCAALSEVAQLCRNQAQKQTPPEALKCVCDDSHVLRDAAVALRARNVWWKRNMPGVNEETLPKHAQNAIPIEPVARASLCRMPPGLSRRPARLGTPFANIAAQSRRIACAHSDHS